MKEKEGLKLKYHITKANGRTIDPNAVYFVLRIDKDRHAIRALRAYAESVEEENPVFARDILDLISCPGYVKKTFDRIIQHHKKVKEMLKRHEAKT